MLDNDATESDDSGQTGSGVFRRLMARDLYELTRRVDGLERHTGNPFSTLSTSWPYIALALIFLVLFAGSMLYFGQRIDNIEKLQRRETLAQRSELESKQRMIDELQQAIRQQADTLRAISASPPSATEETATAAEAVALADAASQRPARAPLPASLEPGEVLLIVASTLTMEEALEQALALELDGHASEVIRGMTGYYGVALGRFDFEQAKSKKSFLVESGVVNSTPYLMTDETIDSYVYP